MVDFAARMGAVAFQFTHPRGVRHNRFHLRFFVLVVSIHAPTRGATPVDWVRIILLHGVSIHAPTRGATHRTGKTRKFIGFQFTHPRGVRPSSTTTGRPCHPFQFTHPRGVRQKRDQQYVLNVGFNSRTHAGCDGDEFSGSGADTAGFNSRTHAGCDL